MKINRSISKPSTLTTLDASQLAAIGGGTVITWSVNGIESSYDTVSKVYTKTVNGHTYQVIDGAMVY
jgi:hypothetical protein